MKVHFGVIDKTRRSTVVSPMRVQNTDCPAKLHGADRIGNCVVYAVIERSVQCTHPSLWGPQSGQGQQLSAYDASPVRAVGLRTRTRPHRFSLTVALIQMHVKMAWQSAIVRQKTTALRSGLIPGIQSLSESLREREVTPAWIDVHESRAELRRGSDAVMLVTASIYPALLTSASSVPNVS